jgi:AcrR family transcriptional regulator
MPTAAKARETRRRSDIVASARQCFLQFGFAKTSLDDIARRAGISRPLIYRQFANKEEIFSAVFADVFGERYPAAERALAAPGTRREKLFRVHEILLLEPWDEMMGAPMAAEFYEACSRLIPAAEAEYESRRLRYTRAVLGSKELAELFVLALDGLEADLPPTRVLRRRLQLLIERFVD